MAKRVLLTWDNGKRQVVEECYLIEEDVDMLIGADGNEYSINKVDAFDGETRVLFEDDNGIFGLRPEQVVDIEVLDQPKPTIVVSDGEVLDMFSKEHDETGGTSTNSSKEPQ